VIPATAIVNVSTLARVIEGSLIAGIGITIVFSLVIWGATRASDYARNDQRGLAVVHGAIATVALAAVAGSVVYGFTILATK
jgi:hypothetical protein